MVSVVGRFLEHSRVYGFQRGDERRVLDRLGRPHAAQPRHARGAARAGRGGVAARTSSRTRSSAAWPTTPSAGSSRPDGDWTRRTGGTRSVHRELMERALERADASAELGCLLQREHPGGAHRGRAPGTLASRRAAVSRRGNTSFQLAEPVIRIRSAPARIERSAAVATPERASTACGLEAVGDDHAAEAELPAQQAGDDGARLGRDPARVERRVERVREHHERHPRGDRRAERDEVALDRTADRSPARRRCSRLRRRARGSAWRWPPRAPSRMPADRGTRARRDPALVSRERARWPSPSPRRGTSATGARFTFTPAPRSCRPRRARRAAHVRRARPGTAALRSAPRSPPCGCRRPPGRPSRAPCRAAAPLERAREPAPRARASPPLRAEQDHAGRLAARAVGAGCSRARRVPGKLEIGDLADLLAERQAVDGLARGLDSRARRRVRRRPRRRPPDAPAVTASQRAAPRNRAPSRRTGQRGEPPPPRRSRGGPPQCRRSASVRRTRAWTGRRSARRPPRRGPPRRSP